MAAFTKNLLYAALKILASAPVPTPKHLCLHVETDLVQWKLKNTILLYLCNCIITPTQACSQVSRFGGVEYIVGGQDFCFYYMFEKNFSRGNKTWGTAPECPPLATGLHKNRWVVAKLCACCVAGLVKV